MKRRKYGKLSDGDWLVQIFSFCSASIRSPLTLGVIKIRWQFLAFQFFELFYLFDLAFDVTVIFNVDIYLFTDIRCQVWTFRIHRCQHIIVQFRTADQLSQCSSCIQRLAVILCHQFLYWTGSSQVYIFYTLYFLFDQLLLFNNIVIAFLWDQTNFVSVSVSDADLHYPDEAANDTLHGKSSYDMAHFSLVTKSSMSTPI